MKNMNLEPETNQETPEEAYQRGMMRDMRRGVVMAMKKAVSPKVWLSM